MSQKILFISLEFGSWVNASHCSYPMNFGMEEGLAANGVEYVTTPAFHEMPASTAGCLWLSGAREIGGEAQFDQARLEIGHSNLDEPFLEWVATLAPMRVGFICESLEIDPGEWINNAVDALRRQKIVEQRLSYLTHIVAVDEIDVERFNTEGPVSAMWWPIEEPTRLTGMARRPRQTAEPKLALAG